MTFPTLTDKGMTKEPETIIDNVIDYFYASNVSQSNLWKNEIISYKFLKQKHGDDINNLCADISTSLNTVFERYFDASNTETTYEDNNGEISIIITISVTANGVVYTGAKSRILDFINN